MYFGDIYTLAYTHKEMNANIHVKNTKYAGCGPFLCTCAIFKKIGWGGQKSCLYALSATQVLKRGNRWCPAFFWLKLWFCFLQISDKQTYEFCFVCCQKSFCSSIVESQCVGWPRLNKLTKANKKGLKIIFLFLISIKNLPTQGKQILKMFRFNRNFQLSFATHYLCNRALVFAKKMSFFKLQMSWNSLLRVSEMSIFLLFTFFQVVNPNSSANYSCWNRYVFFTAEGLNRLLSGWISNAEMKEKQKAAN